jgi:cellulose synthase operon protein YhjQ
MPDRKALVEKNETPEDVATLYSWANLHGAKYRDFSASRAQTREKARQRVQEAIETERQRVREQAEGLKNAEAKRAEDAAIVAEAARRQELAIRDQAQKAEAQAYQQQMQQAMPQQVRPSPRPEPVPNPVISPGYQPAPPQPQEYLYAQPPAPSTQPVYAPSLNAPAHAYSAGQPIQNGHPVQPSQPAYIQPMSHPLYPPPPAVQAANPNLPSGPGVPPVREELYRGREESSLQIRNPWAPAGPRETPAGPAWLSPERSDASSQPVPRAPEDTLQASRDRLTSRWFTLNSVFSGAVAQQEALPAPVAQRAPVLAVFSLAGGVGKTSLVATLGRALSARGERVLLVDTAAYGLLPFFFGARDQRPGVLRTFTAPGTSGDAPIQMITVDPETMGPETAPQETLTQEIARHGRGVGRILVDLATASGATTRRVLRMGPTVLVPVVPDMSSVVSVGAIDAFFQHNVSSSGQHVRPYYVLNQFDPSFPLHLDVREVLREQLGDRLLPFALRRTPAVSEALAEGMTVVDYAPNSTVAEDFGSLAGWVKSLAAPMTSAYRGVRWSER